MMEAEAEVSKEGAAGQGMWAPLETGKGEGAVDSHPEPQKAHTLVVGLLISETVEIINACCLSPEVCGHLLQRQ